MIIFIIVIVVLLRHFRKRSKEHNKKVGNLKLMANITGIAFLFGLTWLFGALTVVNFDQAFQILFTLANSFQGFLIFIFFCVLNSDVRLACGMQKIFGKRLNMQTVLTKQSTLSQDQQDISEQPESVVTEDITTLGLPAKLTRTLTRNKCHMNEVVEVTFDELDKPHESGVLESIVTENMHKLHMEEVGQHQFHEQEARRDDVELKQLESEL